jgi:hypothetical protein
MDKSKLDDLSYETIYTNITDYMVPALATYSVFMVDAVALIVFRDYVLDQKTKLDFAGLRHRNYSAMQTMIEEKIFALLRLVPPPP